MPMKSLAAFVCCLLLYCSTASSQGFQNSLRFVTGWPSQLKELSNGEILAIIHDIRGDSTRIVKLRANGQLYISKSIGPLTDNFLFDNIYEYQNGYVVSYGISKQSFSSTNEPFSEGFMFFDANLVLKHKTQFLIHDSTVLNHQIYYDMSENHVWFGMVHYSHKSKQAFVLKTVRFNPDGSFLDSTSIGVDSLISHHKFIRSFREDSVYKMIVGYNHMLHSYTFSSTLSLLRHDSTSGYQFAANSEVFNTHLGDSGYDDIALHGNQYITTNAATNQSGRSVLSISRSDGNITKTIPVPLPEPAWSFDFSTHYNRRISVKRDKVFIAANYNDSNVEYNYLTYIHQTDTGLNTIKTWPIFNNIQQGNIDAIEATEDGSCLIIGTVWDPFLDQTIYLAKLDSNGVLAYVKPVYSGQGEIVLYPNPGHDFLWGAPSRCVLHLTDMAGKQMKFEPNTNGIDVSGLHVGIYFYQVHNLEGELLSSGKWMKE